MIISVYFCDLRLLINSILAQSGYPVTAQSGYPVTYATVSALND